MTEQTGSNADRLRGLRRQDTPEEPTQRAPQPTPVPSSSIAGSTPAFTPTTPHQTPNKSKTPVVIALAVIGALALTSIVVAFAVRSLESDPAITADASSVQPAPGGNQEVPSATGELSAFDRPTNVPGLINQVTGSTVVVYCDAGEAMGSGFIFDLDSISGPSERVVITNHHVVEGCLDSMQVDVRLGDTYYSGTVIGTDEFADLAVLSALGIQGQPLEPHFEPQVGQWVMAVGAPEGLENSASFGYITNVREDQPLITSDAVIGGGSSGGPLVDNQGRVVAVNFASFTEATGISLSAPITALCLRAVECS